MKVFPDSSSPNMSKKNQKQDAARPEYQLKPREKAAMEKWQARLDATAVAPRLKVVGDNASLATDHEDQPTGVGLLAEAMGSADADFVMDLLCQLGDVEIGRASGRERVL